jgi:hypothetical protein
LISFWKGNKKQDADNLSNFLANPTIASYNAKVIKIYNATSSLHSAKNINICFSFEKTL